MAIEIFILDNLEGRDIGEFIQTAAKELGVDVNIDYGMTRYMREIPGGYQAYLLHLSQTDESAIRGLKEDHPKSKVWGITGGKIPGETNWPELLEGDYCGVGPDKCRTLLKGLQSSMH